jgi:hypothetical protein
MNTIEIWVKMPSGWKFFESVPAKLYGNSLERAQLAYQGACPLAMVNARWAV